MRIKRFNENKLNKNVKVDISKFKNDKPYYDSFINFLNSENIEFDIDNNTIFISEKDINILLKSLWASFIKIDGVDKYITFEELMKRFDCPQINIVNYKDNFIYKNASDDFKNYILTNSYVKIEKEFIYILKDNRNLIVYANINFDINGYVIK